MTTMFTLRTALRSRQVACTRTRPLLQKCWYRGDSGDAQLNLSAAEAALLQVAKPRSEEILARHTRLPSLEHIPKASLDPNTMESEKDVLELNVRRKRLVYRAKQRGWLEVDLLLGTWASLNVPDLNAKELDEFEEFVNFETIDIYNIITLRLDVPEELKTSDGSGVVERIQEWARNSPLGRADPEKYKEVKMYNNLI
jgi:succinate dehydrogenase assembly factor 2